MTEQELQEIEEANMQLLDKEEFIKLIENMVVGEREGAEKVWEQAKKYKGKYLFSYQKDVIKLATEIRILNNWPLGELHVEQSTPGN